jgi:hypothetical protein
MTTQALTRYHFQSWRVRIIGQRTISGLRVDPATACVDP